MADAIFRADLIKSLESEIGRVAAVQAAEIMLSEASEAQIGEVRDLLPEDLKVVVSAVLQPHHCCEDDLQPEESA
jgi:hypothetical protein